MYIDTHCHLTSNDLLPHKEDVLQRAAEAGVGKFVTVATNSADAAIALREFADMPRVFLAAGIHPHEAGKVIERDFESLIALHKGDVAAAWRHRVVAVGETGLDFHYDFSPREVQERVFRAQLELACDIERPVIIHAREAEDRTCDILLDYPDLRDRVVFHCFSKGPHIAERILEAGFWLSFTGVETFKNADEILDTSKLCPA
ncbi:MAG: TatD family hydrolase, partial [Phycisphaerae bacterium]